MLPEQERDLPTVVRRMIDDVEENLPDGIRKRLTGACFIRNGVGQVAVLKKGHGLFIILPVYCGQLSQRSVSPNGVGRMQPKYPAVPYFMRVQYMAEQGPGFRIDFFMVCIQYLRQLLIGVKIIGKKLFEQRFWCFHLIHLVSVNWGMG